AAITSAMIREKPREHGRLERAANLRSQLRLALRYVFRLLISKRTLRYFGRDAEGLIILAWADGHAHAFNLGKVQYEPDDTVVLLAGEHIPPGIFHFENDRVQHLFGDNDRRHRTIGHELQVLVGGIT